MSTGSEGAAGGGRPAAAGGPGGLHPPGSDDAEDPTIELCVFRVGGEEYAIDLRRMREIVQPLPITPVPRAPAFLEGVVDLRGEVVPVLDVRRRLGLPVPPGGRAKMLVVQLAGRIVALLVDAVVEVLRLRRSAIGPPPPFLDEDGPRLFLGVCGAREARASAGVARPSPPRLRLLLNVKALLEPSAPEVAAAARRETEGAVT